MLMELAPVAEDAAAAVAAFAFAFVVAAVEDAGAA
jgi:hypothetical protein